jgi:hypothetical protein
VYPTFRIAQRDCTLCARVFQAGLETCAGPVDWGDSYARETEGNCGAAGNGLRLGCPAGALSPGACQCELAAWPRWTSGDMRLLVQLQKNRSL